MKAWSPQLAALTSQPTLRRAGTKMITSGFSEVLRSTDVIEGPVIDWDALNARRLYIQLTVNCRQRKLTGTDVLLPYSQSSAGDLRVQLY